MFSSDELADSFSDDSVSVACVSHSDPLDISSSKENMPLIKMLKKKRIFTIRKLNEIVSSFKDEMYKNFC